MARRRWQSDDDAPKVKLNKETFREGLKIFEFIRPYKWAFFGGLALIFLSSLTFMIFLYLPGEMIDIVQGKSKHNLTLGDIGLILLVLFILQGIMSYARVMLFAKVSERGLADIRLATYRQLLSMPIPFFEQSRVGELISRLTADVEKLYNTFSITLAEFIRQIVVLVTGILFLAFTTPRLALVMIATFPVIVVGAIFFGRYIRKLSKERQDQIADTNTLLSETLQAIHAVKAFTNEWFELSRYDKSNQKVIGISMKFASRRAWFATFIVTMLFGALFFIIWQGAVMVGNNEITVGQLISFVSYTATIGGAIAALGSFYPELMGSIGATERVREILGKVGELQVQNAEVLPERRLKGDIEFRDVHFRYPSREDVAVLRGVNLRIKSGQKVALVGASGAGKSTIMQLVLRFYQNIDVKDNPSATTENNPVKAGQILVDGKNINDYDITAYRQNLALVPQEVLLFGGTIRENILYGKPNATEADIIEAAKQSNSWEFISQFPEGLDTVVGERGIKLSGGQRQRIAIARAILRNPSILLLDEATSSLDAESEKVVQEALNTLMEGRTSIIIAHRLATVREVDRIYVLDGGRIVEEGRHEELSEKEDGLYASLARLQFEPA
jgi:ABC-type multidrug transport system fused ATPase/permease subunit